MSFGSLRVSAPLFGHASAREIGTHLSVVGDVGPRPDGSDADRRLVDYIERKLRDMGLSPARHPIPVPVVVGAETRLEVVAPERLEVAAIAHLRSGLTPADGVEAPLVFCGRAFAADLAGLDVAGRIALAYEEVPYDTDAPGMVGWHLEKIHRLRDKGAAAVVFCTRRNDNEITTWGLYGLDKRVDDIASVGIGFRDFERLREACGRGPVVARLIHHGVVEQRDADVLSALLPGSDLASEEVVFIGGHHETVPGCGGVNDNGSGIAIMLEAARLLAPRRRRRSIRFLVTCGEESGCWGSQFYLDGISAGARIRAVLNVDQVAGTDVRLIGHGTPWLNTLLIEVAEGAGLVLRTTHEEPKVAAILGDAEPWWQAGHPAAMLSGWWSDPAYHTRADTIRLVNPNYLKTWCDLLAAATDRLADGELPDAA
jgi:aminopeptidase YwaD